MVKPGIFALVFAAVCAARADVSSEVKARLDALVGEMPAITAAAEAAAKRIWENPWASLEVPPMACWGFAEEMWCRAGGLSQIEQSGYDMPQNVVLCAVRSWDDARRFAVEELAKIKRGGKLVIVFGPKADAPAGDWCDFLIDDRAPSGAAREGNVNAIANCALGWAWACEYAAAFTRLANKFPAITRTVFPRDTWIVNGGVQTHAGLPRLKDCTAKIPAGELGGYYLRRARKMANDFDEPHIRDAIDAAARTIAERLAAGRRVMVAGLGHFIIHECTEDIRSPMLGVRVCGLMPDVYGELLDKGDILVWIAYSGMSTPHADYNEPIVDAGVDLIAAFSETTPQPKPKNMVHFIPQPWTFPDAEVPIPVAPWAMASASEISRCLTLRLLDEAVVRELAGRKIAKCEPFRKWAAYDSGMRKLGGSDWLATHLPYDDVSWRDGRRRGGWLRPWTSGKPKPCTVAGAVREQAWGKDRVLFMTRDHTWGLAATNGQVLASASWDMLSPLNGDTLACEKAARYGFMSRDGAAGPLDWDVVRDWGKDRALVAKDRLYGLWDIAAGKLVKPVSFATAELDGVPTRKPPAYKKRWTLPGDWDYVAEPNANGLHPVVMDGKWGVADKTGKPVVACDWDYVRPAASAKFGFEVAKGGVWRFDVAEFPYLYGAKWGAVGEDGKTLLPPEYDAVTPAGDHWVGCTWKKPMRMLP